MINMERFVQQLRRKQNVENYFISFFQENAEVAHAAKRNQYFPELEKPNQAKKKRSKSSNPFLVGINASHDISVERALQRMRNVATNYLDSATKTYSQIGLCI